jgi:hypothetical protein
MRMHMILAANIYLLIGQYISGGGKFLSQTDPAGVKGHKSNNFGLESDLLGEDICTIEYG